MSSELENIILTIDTHEKNQTRIKAVDDWFTGHGATVEHLVLKHCDYRLIGEFRGQSVNLGVEAKGWDNFLSDDIAEMEEKLLKATGEYDHVGFFVETQNYSFTPDENNKHGKLNYSIPRLNKNLPAKTLASFEGMLDTISKHPQIHVRQLRSEMQFPYSLYDLLVYLQKPHVLTVKPEGYVPSLQNLYMQIPQVGIERAKKLIQHYPNLFWLCSAAEESLISIMGMSQGTIIYQYLHNTELQTPEWMAGHCLDGTEKDEPERLICSACGEDKCTCVPHFDNPLLKKDDKGKLRLMPQARTGELATVGLPFDANFKSQHSKSSSTEQASGMEKQPHGNTKLGTPDISSYPSACGNIPVLMDAHVVEGNTSSHPSGYKKVKPKLIGDDKIDEDTIILIKSGLLSYLEGFPEGRTAEEILAHFDCLNNNDSEVMLKCLKSLAVENKITSIHQGIFIISSHPVISKTTPIPPPKKLDDLQDGLPPICGSGVKQESLMLSSPAETHDIGVNDAPLKMVVKCRACHQVIVPEQDDDTGFCQDTECIAERKKPVHAKNLIDSLKLYLKEPHTVPEIVREFGVTSGYAFGSCMGGVKARWLKKVTEQTGKTTFERII